MENSHPFHGSHRFTYRDPFVDDSFGGTSLSSLPMPVETTSTATRGAFVCRAHCGIGECPSGAADSPGATRSEDRLTT